MAPMSARGHLGQLCRLSASRIYKKITRNEGVRSGRLICPANVDTERVHHTTQSRACSSSVPDSAVKINSSRRRGVIGSERKEQYSSNSRETQTLITRASTKDSEDDAGRSFRKRTESGPQLSDFISRDGITGSAMKEKVISTTGSVPYINPKMLHGNQRKGKNSMIAYRACH